MSDLRKQFFFIYLFSDTQAVKLTEIQSVDLIVRRHLVWLHVVLFSNVITAASDTVVLQCCSLLLTQSSRNSSTSKSVTGTIAQSEKQTIWYSDLVMGYMIQDSYVGRGKIFSCSPKHPDCVRCPPNLLLNV